MSKSKFAFAAITLVAALLAGGASADTFAYIGNADSNDISVFRVEPSSGEIKAVETVPFPGRGKAGFVDTACCQPRPATAVRRCPLRALYRLQLCHRWQKRPSHLSRARAARRQHGQYRDRSHRKIPVQRVLRRQQGRDESDWGRRHRRRADAGDPDRAECACLPAVAGQSFRLRHQSRIGPDPELPLRSPPQER